MSRRVKICTVARPSSPRRHYGRGRTGVLRAGSCGWRSPARNWCEASPDRDGAAIHSRHDQAVAILGTLDGFDHDVGLLEGYQRIAPAVAIRAVGRDGASIQRDQRVVECIRCAERRFVPRSHVGQDAIGEAMLALVGLRIGMVGARNRLMRITLSRIS